MSVPKNIRQETDPAKLLRQAFGSHGQAFPIDTTEYCIEDWQIWCVQEALRQLEKQEYEQRRFAETVERMRAKQKEYFSTRDRDVLTESKQLERQVDQFIDRQKKPELF